MDECDTIAAPAFGEGAFLDVVLLVQRNLSDDTRRRMIITRDRTLLIATDIDGTLLDHHAQLPFRADDWRAAIRQLGTQVAGCSVTFASSRTLDELMVLQRGLGVRGPCIAEDGAVLALDKHHGSPNTGGQLPHNDERVYGRRTMRIWRHAQTATQLRAAMGDIAAVHRADASQLDAYALRALGFRTGGATRRALHARYHSLLIDPTRLSGDETQAIRATAAARGLQLRRGGRWLTLADTAGKGTALALLRQFETVWGVSPIVIAIGNEENDLSLLQQADLAFVIRNPGRGPHPALAAIPGVVVLDTEGPSGWLEVLTRVQEFIR